MGGMAAQIPIKDDPTANEEALRAGARGQAARGARTATTAPGSPTPASCRSRTRSSTSTCRAPNQIDRKREDVRVTAQDLLQVPQGTRTEAGLRHNVRVGVQYLEAWLRGNGCVPLYNLMEDAATAEISRTQVWQWLRHRAGARRRARRSPPSGSAACWTRSSRSSGTRSARSGTTRGRFDEAESLFDRMSTSRRVRRVPDPPRLRRAPGPHRQRCQPERSPRRRDDHGRPASSRTRRPPTWLRDVPDGRWAGIARALRARGRRAAARLRAHRAHARRPRRAAAVAAAPHASRTCTRSARSPATRPCRWSAPASRRSTCRGWQVAADANDAGADLPRPEPLPGRQRARTWCAASTARCSAPTRSSTREGGDDAATGSRRSSPTPRPASAARSTPSS